jgi:excisionase family DNA binding protein
VDTIFKTLSAREHKTYARLKARLDRAEQSAEQSDEQSAALPAKPSPEGKPTPRRAHRVQHRLESRDTAPDPEALAYCVKDAARLIGVSRTTLYVLISTGRLRTIKIRKRRLVPREALLDLLTASVA